jgi:hypothetical protein
MAAETLPLRMAKMSLMSKLNCSVINYCLNNCAKVATSLNKAIGSNKKKFKCLYVKIKWLPLRHVSKNAFEARD